MLVQGREHKRAHVSEQKRMGWWSVDAECLTNEGMGCSERRGAMQDAKESQECERCQRPLLLSGVGHGQIISAYWCLQYEHTHTH